MLLEYLLSFYTAQKNVDEIIIEVINNSRQHTVLSETMDGNVVKEIFEKDKSEQLWITGLPDTEGYFTLRNKKGTKFLTRYTETNGEFVINNNVKWQPEYKNLILFQVKDGN